MSRLLQALIVIMALTLCSGWAIMYTTGAGNSFPAATPTPSLNNVTIDQCTSGLRLSSQAGDLPLSLTVATNPNGTPEGLVLIHKGNTTGTDPNQNFLTSMDTFNNVWSNDIARTHSMNGDSVGCLNVDWVPTSNARGSDQVIAKSPGTGLFNAAVLCTVKNFAAYDAASGTPYTAAANALTGVVSPTVSSDLLLGLYYIEAISPAFTNASTNSTTGSGTPTDVAFTVSSTSSNASQLIGITNEAGILNNSLGFQRSFSPAGNFCGGVVAISSTAVAPACLHSPRGFGCGTNPTLRPGFLTYTAIAGDNSAALANEFAQGHDVLIGPANALISVQNSVNLPANINVQCAAGVVLDFSSLTAETGVNSVGLALRHVSNPDNGSFSNCTVRGHNYNANPPGISVTGNNGPLLLTDAQGNGNPGINGYSIVNNYFNGPLGQCGVEYGNTGSPNFTGDTNVSMTFNTFDQCELYGGCFVGATSVTMAHNYSTSCSEGNENNSSQFPYSNVTFNDEENHFGVGDGCYHFGSATGPCGEAAGLCHNNLLAVCASDSGVMSGATGVGQNLIINGDGQCYQLEVSNGNCSPPPTMTNNTLLNGAVCVGGTC